MAEGATSTMRRETEADGGAPAPAVRAQLRRMLANRAFVRAPRLGRFLTYIVDEALAGRFERLKEYSLGVDVFDRGPDFDPKTDPIVRVDARRLRRALGDYYAGEGAGDPVEIVLAPGSYQPAFRLHAGAGARRDEGVRLVVARFEAQPDDPALRSFAEGLTDDLLLALTGRPKLQVVSAPGSAADEDDPAGLARRFGADVALTGKVLRAGAGGVTVRAFLTRGAEGAQTWCGRYDASLAAVGELVALQDELAGEIAAQVAPHLSPPPRGRSRTPTGDPEAYELFLRGRHLLMDADPATLGEAMTLLDAAVARDPTFAEALAALSEAHFVSSVMLLAAPRDSLQASRRFAEAALAVEPELPAARAALGRVSAALDHDLAAAETAFERALQADPASPIVRLSRATYLLAPLGRLAEARSEIAALLEQDPYALWLRLDYARMLGFQGQFDEAIRQLELILAFRPGFPSGVFTLAFAYEHAGRLDLARAAHARHVQELPYPLVAHWAEAAEAVWDGSPERARAIVARMEAEAPPLAATVMADAWLRLGDHDRALDWLEQAAEARLLRILFLAVDADYAPLRGHPRFAALLARVGLGAAVVAS